MGSTALAFGRFVSRGAALLRPSTGALSRSNQPMRAMAASSADSPREVRVSHILVKADQEDKIESLAKELKAGGASAFAAMAAQHSTCPSGSNGGSLGWVKKGMMVPEFEACAFAAEVGVPASCTTQFGHHLVLVEEERASAPQVETMGPLDLAEFLETMGQDDDSVQLVDVREQQELEIASLPGFKHYPLSRFQEWSDNITDDLDPSKRTLCLCHHGMRSGQMAQFLLTQGFTDVVNIAGGIDAYSRLVDNQLQRY